MTDINALAVVDQQQINNLTIKEVKELWCPLVTDKEFGLFIGICKSFGLNPFKREVYLIKYSASAPASIVVGYEVYLKRADRTGKLDGWNVVIVDAGEESERAVITIYRKDFKNPFIWECYKREVAKAQANWKSMPIFMLKKVAIGQGFRLAFPDEMGGMPYVQEELVQEETPKSFVAHKTTATDITPETKPEVKKDTLNAKVCTDEQIETVTVLVSLTKEPAKSSKYICDKYKIDTYGQLSFDEAEEVIKALQESQKKLKEEIAKNAEAKQEEPVETPAEEQGHGESKEKYVGKPATEKQKKSIENMLEHFHEKKEGKRAVLLVKAGAKDMANLTTAQASTIVKELIAQMEKDKAEQKQDEVNHP